MKILSIRPLPCNDFMELHNEDGTLFGFYFEPTAEQRRVNEAFRAATPTVATPYQWGQSTIYGETLVSGFPYGR